MTINFLPGFTLSCHPVHPLTSRLPQAGLTVTAAPFRDIAAASASPPPSCGPGSSAPSREDTIASTGPPLARICSRRLARRSGQRCRQAHPAVHRLVELLGVLQVVLAAGETPDRTDPLFGSGSSDRPPVLSLACSSPGATLKCGEGGYQSRAGYGLSPVGSLSMRTRRPAVAAPESQHARITADVHLPAQTRAAQQRDGTRRGSRCCARFRGNAAGRGGGSTLQAAQRSRARF